MDWGFSGSSICTCPAPPPKWIFIVEKQSVDRVYKESSPQEGVKRETMVGVLMPTQNKALTCLQYSEALASLGQMFSLLVL